MRANAIRRLLTLASAAVLATALATVGIGNARADYSTWNDSANCNN